MCENVDSTIHAPYDSPVLWREDLMKRFVEGVDRGQSIRTNNPREKPTPKLTYRLPEKIMAQANQPNPLKRLVGAEGFEPPTR